MRWVSDDVHPAVIGFDILFSSEKETEPDNRFAQLPKVFDGILAAGFVLFHLGYTSYVLVIPVMAVLIGIYYIAVHYYKAYSAKKSIERAFNKYVAPQVVDEIAKDGTYELKLGGENRNVAVLFGDIRGFTPLSESLEPEQMVDILNGYLELTTSSIFRHGGTLDKFIGDATMAVFNAPFDTEDYIYKQG